MRSLPMIHWVSLYRAPPPAVTSDGQIGYLFKRDSLEDLIVQPLVLASSGWLRTMRERAVHILLEDFLVRP